MQTGTIKINNMKKSVICIALAAVTLAACNNTEKEARARLNNAKSMYERNELFAAKSEIDSIRALYPKEFKVLKEGLSLMRMVEMKEAERNIAFLRQPYSHQDRRSGRTEKGIRF